MGFPLYRIMHLVSLTASYVLIAMISWTSLRLSSNYRSRLILLLLISAFLYLFGETQELQSVSYKEDIIWLKISFLGVAFFPFYFMILSYHNYAMLENQRLPRWMWIFWLPGLVIFLMVVRFPHFRGFYQDSIVQEIYGTVSLSLVRGPWYLLQQVNVVANLTAATVWMVLSSLQDSGRKRTIHILELLTYVAFLALYVLQQLFRDSPMGDIMALALSASMPVFLLSLFTERLASDVYSARLSYFEISDNPVFAFNKNRQLIDANPAAERALNTRKKALINQSWFDILTEVVEDGVRIEQSTKGIGKEVVINGRNYSYKSTVFSDSYGNPLGVIRSLYDVTEIKRFMQLLEDEASTDSLTGLLNRGRWTSVVEKIITQGLRFGQSGTLLVIDLDHFKSINDNYGHQTGDEVLKITASRISQNLRSVDILGRYGGEELVVWLVQTKPSSAFQVAEKLRREICEYPMEFEGNSITLSMSIGLCGQDRISSESLDKFFSLADQGLYSAKQQGRNQVVAVEFPEENAN